MALNINGASFAIQYKRTQPNSIDSTDVWETLEEAQAYASNVDDVVYMPINGLVISVIENNKTYRLIPDESVPATEDRGHYKLQEIATTDLLDKYLSKDLFSSVFGLIDEDGNELDLHGEGVVDLTSSIQAKFGLWTNEFLSAKGLNPADGEVSLTLESLNDVSFSEKTEGLSIVWNGTKWINQLIESGGLDETLLEDYLSKNSYATALDITDAVSSKVDTTTFDSTISEIETLLDTKATKTELTEAVTTLEQSISDVDDDLQTFKTTTEKNLDTKLDIAFFSKVFGLIDEDGSEITVNNDTSITIESILAKFGLWTESFLSAKGLNPSDGSVTGISLKDLAGVKISGPLNGEGLVYQDGYWINQVVQTGESGNPFYVWQGESKDAPTLENAPADQWTTTELKNEHVDDYYVTTEGLVYLFTSEHTWELVTDKYLIDCWNKLDKFDDDLMKRIEALEKGSATNIQTDGAGNVVTEVTKTDTVITVSKGISVYTKSEVDTTVDTINLNVTNINESLNAEIDRAKAAEKVNADNIAAVANKLDKMFTLEGAGSTSDPYKIKANYGLYTEEFLSALGIGSIDGGSSGGSSYSRLDSWDDYVEDSGSVLSAKLGKELYDTQNGLITRVGALEDGTGSVSGEYLPLSGGTLTSSELQVLSINTTNTSGIPAVGFFHNGTRKGVLAYNTTGESFYHYDANFNSGTIILDGWNYNKYVPKLDGTGATGTWAIDITGNAATASEVDWSGVENTPTTLAGYGITNAYTKTQVDNALALKLDKSVWDDVFEIETLTDGTKVLHVLVGLYTDSFLSSLGLNSGTGGSSTGATKLSRLNDVSLGTLNDGQALVYDSTTEKWTNQTIDAVITSAKVIAALGYTPFDANNFTKAKIKSTLGISDWALAATANYLPLTGGTVTGTIKVDDICATNGNGLICYKPATWSGVSDTQWGLGTADIQGVIRSNASDLIHYRSSTNYAILDAYNYNTYSPKLDGTGATGSWGISITGNAATATTATTCTGNAASATKLQTSRTIWGQSFNGTANITGSLTGSYFSIMDRSSNPYLKFNEGTSYTGYVQILTDGSMAIGSTSAKSLKIDQNGYVGVGTDTNSSYRLYVSGAMYLTGYGIDMNSSYGRIEGCRWVRGGIGGDKYMIGSGGDILGSNYEGMLLYSYGDSSGIYLTPRGTSTMSVTPNSVYISGTLRVTTGMYSDGYVSALGQNTSSDMRLKHVLDEVVLSVKDIANAPSVRFSWKNGGGIDVGSSAQYWQGLLPDAVKERDGYLEMQYANIALLSAIALAKNVEIYEERIVRLEREVEKLQHKIRILKNNVKD